MVSVLIKYSLVDYDHCKVIIEKLVTCRSQYRIINRETFMDRSNPHILITQITMADEHKAQTLIQSELLNAESPLKKLKSPYWISLAA